MTKEHELIKQAGHADFLANERTFLAWVRTGIALMGLGFVIVKFALFIRHASYLMGNQMALPENRYSALTGIIMVILGALTTALAFVRYRYIEKQLRQNRFFPTQWLTALVTIIIILGSVLLVVYLWPNVGR
jgi:putative membrane protein